MADESQPTGLIGGPEKRAIEIVDHDPGWSKKFREHAERMHGALGKAALRIEHIGSTSVPGLAAKPVVDILLVVNNSADEASYLPATEAAGYVLRVREPEFQEHRMFRSPERDVHVHVFSEGAKEAARYLVFRDHLRNDAKDRKRYEQLKRALAKRDWDCMDAYAAQKGDLIEELIAKARAGSDKK